jgi:hypothetical protein
MYNSLSHIPVKVFYEILATNNYRLLLEKEDVFVSDEKVMNTWSVLKLDYDRKYSKEENSFFEIRKEIEILSAKHTQITLICHCLKNDWDQDLVNILLENMYVIKDDENYIQYIETIERQVEGLQVKINRLKGHLPQKNEDDEEKAETDLDDVMASFSSILQIDFDFETVSVNKFFALQKQVDLKIQNLKKQSSKTK